MAIHSSEYSDKIFEAFAATSSSRYIYLCNMWTDISRWSKNAVDYFGLPGEYMEGAGAIWEEHIHPEDRQHYRDELDAIFSGHKNTHDLKYRAKDKNGNYVLCTCQGVVIEDDEGQPSFFAGTITNHGIMNTVDPTTNLYNLYEFLQEVRVYKEKHVPARILMVGFKHFSNVNAIYGYNIGDDVIRSFGNKLRDMIRDKGRVFRMDGARFAICTTQLRIDEIKELYNEVQEISKEGFAVEDKKVSLEVCGGAVIMENFTANEHAVHTSARYAFDTSRNEKHGELVVVYDDSADKNKQTIALINELRTCITNQCEGFYLCYQPMVNAKTGELTGVEALLRWKKEPYGEVPPGVFIPWLEKDAVFFDLGNWVLKQAMIDGKEFIEDHPDLVINVNISYAQLERSEFRSKLVSLLANTQFPSEHLCLELTERCSFLNMDFLRNEVVFLKSYGIKIALDDFGTGFSSLNLLRVLPVDYIKIDREFVKEIEKNSIDQTIVRAITECAREMKIPVCVEGIEGENLKEYMGKYNVYGYQGYYYSMPVEKEKFKSLDIYKKRKKT